MITSTTLLGHHNSGVISSSCGPWGATWWMRAPWWWPLRYSKGLKLWSSRATFLHVIRQDLFIIIIFPCGQFLKRNKTTSLFVADLSARVDAVKEENLKLKSENQVLGQYIENLMSASSVFQTTDTKSKRKWVWAETIKTCRRRATSSPQTSLVPNSKCFVTCSACSGSTDSLLICHMALVLGYYRSSIIDKTCGALIACARHTCKKNPCVGNLWMGAKGLQIIVELN